MTKTVTLVGNPNCGKTTLLNALTKASFQVGNWSGVTVEKQETALIIDEQEYKIVDLPGCYSLVAMEEMGVDERATYRYLSKNFSAERHLFINVIDGEHLKRDLYLTLQLLEQGLPMMVVVNCFNDIPIGEEILSRWLNCPVMVLSAKSDQAVNRVKAAIGDYYNHVPLEKSPGQSPWYPSSLCKAFSVCASPEFSAGQWIRVIEGDIVLQQHQAAKVFPHVIQKSIRKLVEHYRQPIDVLMAQIRHDYIDRLLQAVTKKTRQYDNKTIRWLDNIVLNRYLAIPVFFLMIYLLFIFAMSIGGAFQDFFDLSSRALLIDGMRDGLTALHLPVWLITLMADGVGGGCNLTMTFIPVIFCLFFFLSFLEHTGYLTRAAFVLDRLTRWLGLPGQSFVPMILGFGCNVPAIMSARILSRYHERVVTVMMTPFMSCSARLAIYAVFIAAFFQSGQNIIFILYITGIAVAVMTALVLRFPTQKNQSSKLVMELPKYTWPSLSILWRQAWQRLRRFLLKAGAVIVPLNILLVGTGLLEGSASISHMERVGRAITPIFSPMGIEEDNWPAAMGLISGLVAKEVVVGTLNGLYVQSDDVSKEPVVVAEALVEAVRTIPENLANLRTSLWQPFQAAAPAVDVDKQVLGIMHTRFQGEAGAFAYLLFILLYFPCLSVLAVIAKELNNKWAIFSAVWSSVLAYMVAVLFYQLATFTMHPILSLYWVLGISVVFISCVAVIRWKLGHQQSVCDYKALPTPVSFV